MGGVRSAERVTGAIITETLGDTLSCLLGRAPCISRLFSNQRCFVHKQTQGFLN